MPKTDFAQFEKVFYENMKHLQEQLDKPDYSQTGYLMKIAQAYDAISVAYINVIL